MFLLRASLSETSGMKPLGDFRRLVSGLHKIFVHDSWSMCAQEWLVGISVFSRVCRRIIGMSWCAGT